jgi:hypothetical protein
MYNISLYLSYAAVYSAALQYLRTISRLFCNVDYNVIIIKYKIS